MSVDTFSVTVRRSGESRTVWGSLRYTRVNRFGYEEDGVKVDVFTTADRSGEPGYTAEVADHDDAVATAAMVAASMLPG